MKIGYARTSTIEQNYSLEDQIEKLERMGCEKIFNEQVSSVQERPEFQTCIEFAREGDVVVITKLDRFARSITELWWLLWSVCSSYNDPTKCPKSISK